MKLRKKLAAISSLGRILMYRDDLEIKAEDKRNRRELLRGNTELRKGLFSHIHIFLGEGPMGITVKDHIERLKCP